VQQQIIDHQVDKDGIMTAICTCIDLELLLVKIAEVLLLGLKLVFSPCF